MFAERLKLLRKKQGYTQVSLAGELEVSKGTVAMWETGKRTPDFDMLVTLSDLFDVSIDYILGHSDNDSSVKLTEEDIDQLGRWEAESIFYETFKMYLSLDSFGRSAVDSLIKTERLRCHEQGTLEDTSKVRIRIDIDK